MATVSLFNIMFALPAHAQTPPVSNGTSSRALQPAGNLALKTPAAAATSKPLITQYKIDNWQTEHGLPQNTVQAVYQSRAGYLWIGTADGLARFDGVRYATFESAAVPEISSGPINGFMEDAEGALWIGHSRGAARYRNGRFEPAFANSLTEGRRVYAFAQGKDGVVWAASESGLVRWEAGNAKIFKEADGLPTNRLRSLDFDRDGTLWIGTSGGGLVAFLENKFSVMNPATGFPHREVRHVLADPAGGIWAATPGAGLVHVDKSKAQDPIKIYTVADGLPTNQLTHLARDKTGTLWIGTWGAGLSRMSDGRFSTISSQGGLAGDQIWTVEIDREGGVWAGTWNGGLNRLSNRAFGVFGKPEGLQSDNVRSVIHTRNGVTWTSTAGGGVHKIEGTRVTNIGKKDGLATDESSNLFEDRDGAIWIGSYTEGVSRYTEGVNQYTEGAAGLAQVQEKEKSKTKIENFGLEKGLPNTDVRVITQDRAGTLWVGTKAGIARFDVKSQTFKPVREPGAPLEGVAAIIEDKTGTLWFGTTGQGLVSFRNGVFETLTRKQGLLSNWILALYEDSAGAIWIGTNGEGLNRLKDGRMSAIRATDGLWDNVVQTIIEDRGGNLWITCNRGFYRVSRAELDAFADGRAPKITSTGFGPGDALRSTTFAGGLQPAGSIDSKGHLWLPSLKGLVIVDPQYLPGTGVPPQVIFEDITVNGVKVNADIGIAIAPGAMPLQIRYTAGTLSNADRVKFRYQMEGITENWIEVGKNREASFPTLPHGEYQFRVASSVDGMRWQEAAKPLSIVVAPHFYQTRWFLVAALLGSIGITVMLFRLRTHQLRTRHAEMTRLVAEKTDALRLANEHLSRLSFADALTGLANRRRLDETLETEWRRAARLQTPLALILVDIDFFKAYNDTLGHPEGDKCLVAIAEVIRRVASRAGDFAARYGGEEFIILIPGFDHAAAMAYADMLRQACEARAIQHPASPVGEVVTISLGVAATIPSNKNTAATLIAEADAALYRAKKEGRNRVK